MSRRPLPGGGKDGRVTIQIVTTPDVAHAFRTVAARYRHTASAFGQKVIGRVLEKHGFTADGRPVTPDHDR